MPRFDKTGPLGYGPNTGRGMGPCGGGMGYNRDGRCGYGFGRFWRFGSQVSPKDEKQALEEEAKDLEEELKNIKERLLELSPKK